jgi:hypothetical protein
LVGFVDESVTPMGLADYFVGDVQWRTDKIPRTDIGRLIGNGNHGDGALGSTAARNHGQADTGPLTIAGPEYQYAGTHFRMCVVANGTDEDGCPQGMLEIVTIADLARFYEAVGPA